MRPRVTRTSALVVALALAAGCAGKDNDTSSETPATDAAGATTTAAEAAETTSGGSTETSAEPTTTVSEPAPSPTTPAATSEVDEITWATYREPNTLDPIYAFDYPENTTISAMCESLLVQQPDGSIAPGLATLDRPDDLTMVFTLREGVTFSDGSPLTPEDVVFSLQRQMDPALGGFYGAAFSRVASIAATGPAEVTITLNQPDYWLDGNLAATSGVILSKAFVESQGPAYGTPGGGVMCTGPFTLDSWSPGDRISLVRNETYWNGTPKVGRIDIVGVPDEATLASALLTGDIDGSYIGTFNAIDRLSADPSLTVSEAPSYASAALIVSNLSGALADADVRNALSMALDREGLISAVFQGHAVAPRALANQGTYGYAPEAFEAAWDALPEPTQDVEAARELVEAAGVAGQKIVLASTNEIASVATMTNAIKSAAEEIGLIVEMQAVSAANYINLFIDPNARAGVDGFVTVNYPNFADPASLYATFILQDGGQNYSGYDNPEITALLDEARTTADPDARAQLVIEAQALIQQELPWIPIANPASVLVTSAELTGAPSSFVYMFSPWAAGLGGVG